MDNTLRLRSNVLSLLIHCGLEAMCCVWKNALQLRGNVLSSENALRLRGNVLSFANTLRLRGNVFESDNILRLRGNVQSL